MFRRQRDYQATAVAHGIELPEGYRRYHATSDGSSQTFAATPSAGSPVTTTSWPRT